MEQGNIKNAATAAEKPSVAGVALQEQTKTASQKEAANTTEVESERIATWKKRQEKSSSIVFKKKDPKKDLIAPEFKNNNMTPREEYVVQAATMCASMGCADIQYSNHSLSQTISAMFKNAPLDSADYANMTTELLLSFEPQDALEGMLCTRLIVLQNHFMQYMAGCANPEQTSAGIDINLNRATKMGRLFNETLDALNKHRRKGEQKVTVQHVNVNNGGQAIVGANFNKTGEGEHDRK